MPGCLHTLSAGKADQIQSVRQEAAAQGQAWLVICGAGSSGGQAFGCQVALFFPFSKPSGHTVGSQSVSVVVCLQHHEREEDLEDQVGGVKTIYQTVKIATCGRRCDVT